MSRRPADRPRSSRRLRIAVDAVAVRGGGGRAYLLNILAALCAAKPGHEYLVVLTPCQREIAAALPPGARPMVCRSAPPATPLRAAWEQTVLPLLLRRWGVDLLFAAFNTGPVLSPVPVILVAHSINAFSTLPIRWPLAASIRLAGLRRLGRLSARRARAVVFVSHTSARVMGPRMGVHPERVRVIPYGWRPAEPAVGAPGPTLPGRYILTVGDLLEHKNIEVLLRAFERLVDAQGYPGDLVVAGGFPKGGGHYARALAALRAELPCGDRIHFTGALDPGVLDGVYRAAEMFVLPSLEETFGLPLVEAMGAGIPVAVGDWRLAHGGEDGRTNVGPEICGSAAEFFDPTDPASMADAMWRVLSDPVRRQELVRAGPARAGIFSWDRAASDLLDVFDAVVPR